MKKLMNVLLIGMLGMCFGLSAKRTKPIYQDIQIYNRSSLPAVITFAGQDEDCKVVSTLQGKTRETFRVPCKALASITIKSEAQGGAIVKEFLNPQGTKFTIESNKVWSNQALDRLKFTPTR